MEDSIELIKRMELSSQLKNSRMNLALLSIVIFAASACLSSGDVDRCDDERQFFTTPNLMARMLVLGRLTTRSDFREFPLLHRLIIFTSELNCDDFYVNPFVTVRLNGVTCKVNRGVAMIVVMCWHF